MGKNLVIIGGGAGGASTAAKAKRNDPSFEVTRLLPVAPALCDSEW